MLKFNSRHTSTNERYERAVKPVRDRKAIRLIESMSAPYAAIVSIKGAKEAIAPVIAPALRIAGRRTLTFQGIRARNVLLILLMICSDLAVVNWVDQPSRPPDQSRVG